MDTLRAYLIKSYWTQTFFRLATAKTFFSAIGLFWLLTEISSFVFESWRAPLQSSWMYFLYMSCAYTLWQRRPIISICERLNGTDVRVEIRIADIFSLPHAKVISTNTTFETTVDETLISSRSLQGKFTKRFYKSSKQLDIELASALKNAPTLSSRQGRSNGKRIDYPIGTVALVSPKGNTTYLVAIADLNENGVAESSFENVKKSLAALWAFISSRGRYEPLAIPILGTGHGRICTPRHIVVKEIIKSFVAACSERAFTKKLTITIAPSDYHEHDLDIYELGEFLKFVCRYTEINPIRQGRGTGTG
ncbi:MAG: hypothetical protein RLZZ33_2189 [Pseudomonadota bacterium]|jgi:hypothetical protein